MKKLLSTLLASTMILSLATTSFALETSQTAQKELQTATLSISDFVIEDGVISGYTGAGGAVVIPSTINGQVVTEIGEAAFKGNQSITSVVIPDSVTSIGNCAFEYCSSLTSVTTTLGLL